MMPARVSTVLLAAVASTLAFAQPPAPFLPPSDPNARLESAISLEKAGQTQAAVRQFRELLRAAPPPKVAGQARLELVRIHGRRGEWWEAAEQLQELRKLAPGDVEYAYQLGVVYRNLSKSAFEHMRTMGPLSARFQQLLGEQYSVGGDSAKAVYAFSQAIQADPKLGGSHLALSMVYLREGKRDQALAEIDKELEIAPESAVAKRVREAIAQLGHGN
jgi:tetratricopeptide (TPR) repeat protein